MSAQATWKHIIWVGAQQPVHWFLGGKGLAVGTKQRVHWYLQGKGLGIQQEMSIWVGSPKS